jgi:hypothetical protein
VLIFQVLLAALLSLQNASASHTPVSRSVQPDSNSVFQRDIDTAFIAIMQTQTGRAVCQQILGAQVDAIEAHLGVSHDAALTISQGCVGATENAWIYPTAPHDIRKMTGRSYRPLSSPRNFRIESWTDPFTNTTVLLSDSNGISNEQMVQRLAHEMAVYLDSKANPAFRDAQNIPELRDLNFKLSLEQNVQTMRPLVAITDPMTAHSLTFIRALRVEYSIVSELVKNGTIRRPADFDDRYLNLLISDKCNENCLETFVERLRPVYLDLSLPLMAFAPHFRDLLAVELPRLNSAWAIQDWTRLSEALDLFPNEYLANKYSGNLMADLERVTNAPRELAGASQQTRYFMNEQLWPLEWPAIRSAKANATQTLLEYMSRPLMSGFNVQLASGPRVRISTGNAE